MRTARKANSGGINKKKKDARIATAYVLRF